MTTGDHESMNGTDHTMLFIWPKVAIVLLAILGFPDLALACRKWKEKAKNMELELQQCYKAQSRLLEQLVVEGAKCQAAKASIQEKETTINELQEEVAQLSFVAFISNAGNKTGTVVEFRNKTYHLLAWLVRILLDCKNVVYNTAKVSLLSMFHCLGETLLLVQIIV
ncbi:hypothetical protein Cgig2_011900 [Carnegiea gigantea]|uniref:Beta-galactosidase beta-sandwich domain-containing protein n=1 Tax=Carnegiea gigantea TaxID=171969 RepID=A0A9Q1Q6H2_9CARY|nr:hypothetical protein Cgig2_011900 [Carnegiea gigantea]